MNAYLLALLVLLGHDNFRTREAATRALERFPVCLWSDLTKCASHFSDIEVALRCRMLAEKHWQKLPLAERLELAAKLRPQCMGWKRQWQKLPWAPQEYEELADSQLSKGFTRGWSRYREATRLLVVEVVCRGGTLQGVQRMLDWFGTSELAEWAVNTFDEDEDEIVGRDEDFHEDVEDSEDGWEKGYAVSSREDGHVDR